MSRRLATTLAHHPIAVGLLAVVATLLLALPLVLLSPEGSASQEPGGPAFDTREVLDTRLAPTTATEFVIVEAPAGDVLDAATLRELDRRLERLRTHPSTAPLLVTEPGPLGRTDAGTTALTDLLDTLLTADGGLHAAPDTAVHTAVGEVVELVGGPAALGLATEAVQLDGRWSAPALTLTLRLDNEALGGGSGGARVGADTSDRERQLRAVRDVLRGGDPGADVERADAGPLVAHAVAADVNLTADEQGQAAGPFIGVTVFLTLALVGLVFRSVWAVAVVGTGVAMSMIWLRGGANLLGLQQDQILATIVPIALVAFGVDFAFHAIGRMREERASGRTPPAAATAGLVGVGGALLLVLASDAAAFLANTVSGIDAIVQFGVAATLGLTAAYLLLGIVAPTVLAALPVASSRPGPARRVAALGAGTLLAGAATGSVLLTVYVAPIGGVASFVALASFGVALPAAIAHRRRRALPGGPPDTDRTATAEATTAGATTAGATTAGATTAGATTARAGRWLGAGVVALARRGTVILPVAGLVTAVAVVGALDVETRFDVQDFFAADTDFVAGLDALDRHIGDGGGEATQLVVTADLTDPTVLARLSREVDDLRDLDDGLFATDDAGATLVDGGVVDLLRDAMADTASRTQISATTGIVLGDGAAGLPDTAVGSAAVIEVAHNEGVSRDDGTVYWGPARTSSVIDRGPSDDATVLTLQLPDSRELTTIERAIDGLEPRVDALRADLRAVDPDAEVVLTGSAIVRQLTLDAVSDALLRSLPIALVACLVVAGIAMRSVRFALVAIAPIVLVVPWLYGTMAAAGYAVNLVTGTIGAISIGIGIDFAIHVIARFREEVARQPDRDAAMRATAQGTGTALVASAGSSMIGFIALTFAPMPLFATYGLLTAVMIAMALVATLVVLPPLLYLLTPAPRAAPAASVPDRHVTAVG